VPSDWLKFRASGITFPIRLGVRRLVFSTLNKVEVVLAFSILLNLVLAGSNLKKWTFVFYYLAFFIVAIQSLWMLPALDARAELHIQGLSVPASNLHFYYVGAEFIKFFLVLHY
jgi:hypothetical protein